MSATKNVDLPQNEQGWLDLVSEILSGILRTVGEAASSPFDAVWPHVVCTWRRARGFVAAHPKFVFALIILVLGVLLAQPVAKAIVVALGFGNPGVTIGSVAARIQSALYGGFVPPGSSFSFIQSFGAK